VNAPARNTRLLDWALFNITHPMNHVPTISIVSPHPASAFEPEQRDGSYVKILLLSKPSMVMDCSESGTEKTAEKVGSVGTIAQHFSNRGEIPVEFVWQIRSVDLCRFWKSIR
jgi:hypothetical protein